jgi:hypothetical protein
MSGQGSPNKRLRKPQTSGIAAAVKFAEGIVAMRLATSQIGPFASDLAA